MVIKVTGYIPAMVDAAVGWGPEIGMEHHHDELAVSLLLPSVEVGPPPHLCCLDQALTVREVFHLPHREGNLGASQHHLLQIGICTDCKEKSFVQT